MGERQIVEQPDAGAAAWGAGRRRRGQSETAGESDRARTPIAREAEIDRRQGRDRRRQVGFHDRRRPLSRQARQGTWAPRREDKEPDPGDQLDRQTHPPVAPPPPLTPRRAVWAVAR